MENKFIVGIDVSKSWLDAALISSEQKEKVEHIQITNNNKGMEKLLKWLNGFDDFDLSKTTFCMEHTGVYNLPALRFFLYNQCNVWLENPSNIKKSLGLQRGKNDEIDARRIAQFAFKNIDSVKLWKPVREVVDTIKNLMVLRERLLQSKKQLLAPVEEFKAMGEKQTAKMLEKSMAHAIKGIEKDIEQTEKKIKDIIDSDDDLKKLFKLVVSIVGIGFVSAINLIIHTNEFKNFICPKKFACYCGVAPFEYKSGSSIKGRTRVSHLANKKMKTTLHLASLSAVKFDAELKEYYERKVAEGKNKMSVLNAVRNKLINRIFVVVNRGTEYVKRNNLNNLVLS